MGYRKSSPVFEPGKIWVAKNSKWRGEKFVFLRIEREMWVGRSLTDGGEIEIELEIAEDHLEPEK